MTESPSSVAAAEAMFHVLGALEWLNRAECAEPGATRCAAIQAAHRGSGGVSYHDRDARQHELHGYGEVPLSGLQFVSVLYVPAQTTAPRVPMGLDPSGPSAAAEQLHAAKRAKRGDANGGAGGTGGGCGGDWT